MSNNQPRALNLCPICKTSGTCQEVVGGVAHNSMPNQPKQIQTEQFLCQSYFDDGGELHDCSCGKCEPKDCMFQYATRQEIIEDTGLITKTEADSLWEKYQDDIKRKWNDFESPQMVIWGDCDTETDYHTAKKELDYSDCELVNGAFYRVTRERIE